MSVNKRRVLELFTKEKLKDLVDNFGISVPVNKPKAEFVTALVRPRSITVSDVLNVLNRDELKEVCRGVGLDDTGRAKQELVDRILGEDGSNTEDDEETDPEDNGGVSSGQNTVSEDAEDAVKDAGFSLANPEPKPKPEPVAKKKLFPGPRAKRKKGERAEVISYRHLDLRKNNPHVGLVNEETDPYMPGTRWAYDPHIDPNLEFDVGRAQVERLIDDALESGDEGVMRAALEELKRAQSPYLNWTGKAERTSFEVDTVSLHVHERIDPRSILSAVRKKMNEKGTSGGHQLGLFSAPFENLPLRDAIDFYKHDKGWSNRLIAGDSLLVMNSLLKKESMAGQVQMIYIDPPYGIKYGSNFQPFVNNRKVEDRKDEDLTQEPEMIRAFRDTWQLGIHSYLSYLRDRLLLAYDLLSESGSIFVQISDENLHHARELLDEIFNRGNLVNTISFLRGGAQTTTSGLPQIGDYILWYAKDIKMAKKRPLLIQDGGWAARSQDLWIESDAGNRKRTRNSTIRENEKLLTHRAMESARDTGSQLNRFEIKFEGKTYLPKRGWSTTPVGARRLGISQRILPIGSNPRFVVYLNDFPFSSLTSSWQDTIESGFSADRIYVVQTQMKVIERCMLLTTDPGDLVFDPTCGSGTTAYIAEKQGRRWISCDTSRVAVTLAKQRLMTAQYDYYDLRYPREGLKGGFVYRTVPHITLKSIANNPEIDEIYKKKHPAIEDALASLNAAAKQKMQEWGVPFDFPDDWPEDARQPFDAFHAARVSMQKQIDDSIANHADQEILYDQPSVDKNRLRVTGPFSVEAVPFATVLSLDEAETPDHPDISIARSGESSRQHQWRDELLKTGIRGKGGQILKFAEFEAQVGTKHIHASGTLAETGDRVVVSFGPEHAALEQRQVERAVREAETLFPHPKMIVFCAFTFDPEAAKDIDAFKGITALKAQMNTDLLTEDLKKGRSTNQSFWLMGQPDVAVRRNKDGLYVVEVNGFDYFDTKSGELLSGGKKNIAVWMLDTDYDDRSLLPHQVFFPMAGKKDGWYKLKKDLRAELNESLLSKYHGTVSLPFDAGENRKIAVKIVDDRGIESLKVIELD